MASSRVVGWESKESLDAIRGILADTTLFHNMSEQTNRTADVRYSPSVRFSFVNPLL